jgi:hypothetical protein
VDYPKFIKEQPLENSDLFDRLVSIVINHPNQRTEAFKAWGTTSFNTPKQHAWFMERAQEIQFNHPQWDMIEFLDFIDDAVNKESLRKWMNDCSATTKKGDTVSQLLMAIHNAEHGAPKRPWIFRGEQARFLADLPPPTAVVGGLLHRGHVTVLSAPPYSGKSWFSINLATAIASQSTEKAAPWPGAVLEAPATPTVYISPDFPVSELARRCRILDQQRSDLVQADSYWENMTLVGDAGGVIMPRERYCLDADGTDRIIEEVIPEGASLLVLDTLSASLPLDVTENDNAGMARVMGNVQKIASQRDIAVLLIHHTAKPTAGKAGSEVWSSVRGAGAISGSASSNALIEQLPDDAFPNVRRLRTVSNVSSALPTTYFEVRPAYLTTDEILYFRPIPDPTLEKEEDEGDDPFPHPRR